MQICTEMTVADKTQNTYSKQPVPAMMIATGVELVE